MTPNDLIPTPRWLLGQLLQVITAQTTSLTLTSPATSNSASS